MHLKLSRDASTSKSLEAPEEGLRMVRAGIMSAQCHYVLQAAVRPLLEGFQDPAQTVHLHPVDKTQTLEQGLGLGLR